MTDDWGARLLSDWSIKHGWWFVAAVLSTTVVIRFITTALAAWQIYWNGRQDGGREGWGTIFCRRFLGVLEPNRKWEPEYWLPTALGLIELVAFSVLIAVKAWPAVGAWFTLKTVAQFESWKKDRNVFNRFLIGNALMLIAAWFLARHFIHVPG